ncbi:MAG TPA: hypothetical protein VM096_00195 [Vicinamibacterales bacterium]|nr:hypothetical protein [Vicinamibacterales bacterium]
MKHIGASLAALVLTLVPTRAAVSAHQDSPSEFVAFRVDDRRVVAVIANDTGDQAEAEKVPAPPAAKYGFGFTRADATAPGSAADIVASARQWIVHTAPGRRFDAVADGVVRGFRSCSGNTGMLLTVDARQQQEFAKDPARYFVASALAGATPVTPQQALGAATPAVTFPDTRRLELETLLNAYMKREFPEVQKDAAAEITRAESQADSPWRAWARTRQDIAAGLAAGRARLTYDVQGFRLDPRQTAAYFVRAEWKIDGRPGFGAVLWIQDNDGLKIYSADPQPAVWLGMREFRGQLRREHYGMVLNVIDRDNDGWREILFLREGYEGFSIEMIEFGATGWEPAGASYSGGC